MQRELEYLLRYISNEAYWKVLKGNGDYVLDNLVDNRVEVELNIKYLIKYGVKNIDQVVVERLDDLLLGHNEFIEKLGEYERKLGRDGLVAMLDNS